MLLHPSLVPVLDMLRTGGDLDLAQENPLLEEADEERAGCTSPGLAAAILSEVTLLRFSLARERTIPLNYETVGSRRTTADEQGLLVLIGAFRKVNSSGPVEFAAAAMGVPPDGFTCMTAANLASKIEQAGLPWPALGRGQISPGPRPDGDAPVPLAPPDDAAFKFRT